MASDTGGVPAFSIQGRLYRERERLSFGGMTKEERAFRKQWIRDQVLAQNEPVEVPELKLATTNVFKRILKTPLDVLVYNPLKLKMKPATAFVVRSLTGKLLTSIWFIYAAAYYFKYNQNDWTRKGGWRVIANRPACFPGETCHDKVKYDPLQEVSFDWASSLKADPFEINGEKTADLDLRASEPGEQIQAVEVKLPAEGEAEPGGSELVEKAKISDSSDGNLKPGPKNKSPCSSNGFDKGPCYRSLGSYYASRGFDQSPI